MLCRNISVKWRLRIAEQGHAAYIRTCSTMQYHPSWVAQLKRNQYRLPNRNFVLFCDWKCWASLCRWQNWEHPYLQLTGSYWLIEFLVASRTSIQLRGQELDALCIRLEHARNTTWMMSERSYLTTVCIVLLNNHCWLVACISLSYRVFNSYYKTQSNHSSDTH